MRSLILLLALAAAPRPSEAQARPFDAAEWLVRARPTQNAALLAELDAATGWSRACSAARDIPGDSFSGPQAPFTIFDMTPRRWGTLVAIPCAEARPHATVVVHVMGRGAAVVAAQRVGLDGGPDGTPAGVFSSEPVVSPLRRTFEVIERTDGAGRPADAICGRVHKFAVTGLGTTRLVQAFGVPCDPNAASVLNWPRIYPAD